MGVWFCEMEINCSKQWDELSETGDSLRRDCGDCGKSVHFVDTQEQLEDAALNGKCVAFYKVRDQDIPLRDRIQLRRKCIENKPADPNKVSLMTLGLPRSRRPNEKIQSFDEIMEEIEKKLKK